MGACGSSTEKIGTVLDTGAKATLVSSSQSDPEVVALARETNLILPESPERSEEILAIDNQQASKPLLSDDGRRGSKTTAGGRRQSRRTSTRRRSSAGSEGGVGSWFHWDIFGGKVVDDDMGAPVSEELGLYFEWAETRVKCYDTHARRVAMKSHRLWKNEYKVRSDPRMTFRVRRFDGVTGELVCGWHVINGSVLPKQCKMWQIYAPISSL
jgi:hypothetical protein